MHNWRGFAPFLCHLLKKLNRCGRLYLVQLCFHLNPAVL